MPSLPPCSFRYIEKCCFNGGGNLDTSGVNAPEIALRGEAIRCQKVADKINRSKEAPMLEGTDFVGGSVESPEFMLDGTASLFDGGQPHASTCLG